MDLKTALMEVAAELELIDVHVKFRIHTYKRLVAPMDDPEGPKKEVELTGIDVIGREIADRFIAKCELKKRNLPFYAHYAPPIERLSRL